MKNRMRIIFSLLCAFAMFNIYGIEYLHIKDAKNVQGEKFDEFAVMPVTSLEIGQYRLEITSKEGFPAKLITDRNSNPISLCLYKGAILTVTSMDGTHDFQSLSVKGSGRAYRPIEVAEGTNGTFTHDADIYYSGGLTWFRPEHEAVIDAVSIRLPMVNNEYGESPYYEITKILVDGLKPTLEVVGDVTITPVGNYISEAKIKVCAKNCLRVYFTPWGGGNQVGLTEVIDTNGNEDIDLKFRIVDYYSYEVEIEARNEMMETEMIVVEIPPQIASIDQVEVSSDPVIDVYTLSGIQVAHKVLKSEIRNILSPGFYIVVSENTTEKIKIG